MNSNIVWEHMGIVPNKNRNFDTMCILIAVLFLFYSEWQNGKKYANKMCK